MFKSHTCFSERKRAQENDKDGKTIIGCYLDVFSLKNVFCLIHRRHQYFCSRSRRLHHHRSTRWFLYIVSLFPPYFLNRKVMNVHCALSNAPAFKCIERDWSDIKKYT